MGQQQKDKTMTELLKAKTVFLTSERLNQTRTTENMTEIQSWRLEPTWTGFPPQKGP